MSLANEDYILSWYVAQVQSGRGAKAWGELKHYGFSLDWFSDAEDKPARKLAKWLLDNKGVMDIRKISQALPEVRAYIASLHGGGWASTWGELPSALEAARLGYIQKEERKLAHTNFNTIEEYRAARAELDRRIAQLNQGDLVRPMIEAVEDYVRDVDLLKQGKVSQFYLETGFPSLNAIQLTERGGLGMIMGETGKGKSTLAGNIVLHSAMAGNTWLIQNLEMLDKQTVGRWVASTNSINHQNLVRQRASGAEYDQAMAGGYDLAELPIFFTQEHITTLEGLKAAMYTLPRVDGVLVDWAELVEMEINDPTQRARQLATRLKALAREFVNADGTHPTILVVWDQNKSDLILPTAKHAAYGGQFAPSCIVSVIPDVLKYTHKNHPQHKEMIMHLSRLELLLGSIDDLGYDNQGYLITQANYTHQSYWLGAVKVRHGAGGMKHGILPNFKFTPEYNLFEELS